MARRGRVMSVSIVTTDVILRPAALATGDGCEIAHCIGYCLAGTEDEISATITVLAKRLPTVFWMTCAGRVLAVLKSVT